MEGGKSHRKSHKAKKGGEFFTPAALAAATLAGVSYALNKDHSAKHTSKKSPKHSFDITKPFAGGKRKKHGGDGEVPPVATPEQSTPTESPGLMSKFTSLFSSEDKKEEAPAAVATPVTTGGKRKSRKGKKHGGEGEMSTDAPLFPMSESVPVTPESSTGGKRKSRKGKKHGGEGEITPESPLLPPPEPVLSSESSVGGAKRKSRKGKKHGGEGEMTPELPTMPEVTTTGGKRKSRKGKKHGGNEEATPSTEYEPISSENKRDLVNEPMPMSDAELLGDSAESTGGKRRHRKSKK